MQQACHAVSSDDSGCLQTGRQGLCWAQAAWESGNFPELILVQHPTQQLVRQRVVVLGADMTWCWALSAVHKSTQTLNPDSSGWPLLAPSRLLSLACLRPG